MWVGDIVHFYPSTDRLCDLGGVTSVTDAPSGAPYFPFFPSFQHWERSYEVKMEVGKQDGQGMPVPGVRGWRGVERDCR